MVKVVLHNIESVSRSDRVFWMLEELEIPYRVRTFLRIPTLMRAADPDLFNYALFGKGPAISLDDESFGESGYVIQRVLSHPDIAASAPTDIEAGDEISNWSFHWLHAGEAAGMNWLQEEDMIRHGGAAWAAGLVGDATEEEKKGILKWTNWYATEIDRQQSDNFLDKTEKWLAQYPGKNFTGTDKFGAGDFMMLSTMRSLFEDGGVRIGKGFKTGPHMKAWWDRVSVRPAYQRSVKRCAREEEEAREAKDSVAAAK